MELTCLCFNCRYAIPESLYEADCWCKAKREYIEDIIEDCTDYKNCEEIDD